MMTVQDVIHLALPPGTRVVAGSAGLGREVTWATRLRPSPPAFGHLTGGELVLLPAAVLEMLDERLTLDAALRQLVNFGVAAIAHTGQITPAAKTFADDVTIPLLQLPADADLGLLEREASRLITDRRREAQRLGQTIGRQLMEMAIGGDSLASMVQTLAELSGKPVALENRDGRLLTYHSPETGGSSRDEIAPILEQTYSTVSPWLRTSAASSPVEPPTTVSRLDESRQRVVAPINGREGLLGSLSLILEDKEDLGDTALMTSRGAAACAVALAREQAAATARHEVELNVLDEVLDGALRSEISLLQQAKRLGQDLDTPHVAIIARLDQSGPVPSRGGRWAVLDDVMRRRDATVLWRLRQNNAEIIWSVTTMENAKRVAAELFQELNRRIPQRNNEDLQISMGVGRIESGLEGIRRSHRQAKQALMMGRRLSGPGHLTTFDDLGVYRLLFAAEQLPELRVFHDENLNQLIAYDTEHGGELIHTLDAFFTARCSPKETATLLAVHRNTVLYRLDRIRAITGLDLDDSAVRLRLHLALCAHLALYS